jgi:hypothetical protein
MVDPHEAAEDLMQVGLGREQAERVAFVAWWLENVGPMRREQLQNFFAPCFGEKKTQALTDVCLAASLDAYPIAHARAQRSP